MDLHLQNWYRETGLYHRLVEVFSDDHAAAGSNHCHQPGAEELIGPAEKGGELPLGPEDKARLVQCRSQDPHPVLLQQPGMLEAASAWAVQYHNFYSQVAQGVKGSYDGARPGMKHLYVLSIARHHPSPKAFHT
jgi:hypothetical protein